MEKKTEKKKKNKQIVQNQNFFKNYFTYNNHEGYNDAPYRKFKHENHCKCDRGNGREMRSHFNNFNKKTLRNKEGVKIPGLMDVKVDPWSEEAAEEERKRQVSDTANELKNKLKMWNAVKSEKVEVNEGRCNKRKFEDLSEDDQALPVQRSELNHENNEAIVPEPGPSHVGVHEVQEDKMNEKNCNRSIQGTSHKKRKNNMTSFQGNSHKSHILSSASQNRQKKIQRSLIGDLMAIPKASLKKVLVNPQIHPKIEQKMAQIVKENRLLLAQKFRSLAESKINQQEQFAYSKFVDDMEDLIDSDLAVDLCQLPPEFISQISDIFQLDFDDSLKISKIQGNSNSDYSMNESFDAEIESISSNANIKDKNTEDDTEDDDDDEKIPTIRVAAGISSNAKCNNSLEKKIMNPCETPSKHKNFQNAFHTESNRQSLSFVSSPVVSTETPTTSCEVDVPERSGEPPYIVDECSYLPKKIKLEPKDDEESGYVDEFFCDNLTGITYAEGRCRIPVGEALDLKEDLPQQQTSNAIKSQKEESVQDGCDNVINSVEEKVSNNERPGCQSTESQTEINLIEADHSQPFFGHLYSDGTETLLLREMEMIDDLLHRLNQRKFIIFLKLVGLESCNLNKNKLKMNLMQTITSSDANLMRELSIQANKKGTRKHVKKKKNPENQKNASKQEKKKVVHNN